MGLTVTEITTGFDGAEIGFSVDGKIKGSISLSVDEIRKYTGRDAINSEECAEVVRKNLLDNLMTEEENGRMMPEGYRWPRFEGDEPVLIGDKVSFGDDGGAVSSIELQDEGYFLLHVCDGAGYFSQCHFSPGERVKRPPVLAADGKPLEPGQTVWGVDSGKKYDVTWLEGDVAIVDTYEGLASKVFASKLTHTKPKIDSWERIVSIDPRGNGDYTHTYEEMIVRCRDCAHASPAGLDCDPDKLYCVVIDWIMSPDGFCSFGERRDAR